ncbi:TetR family transcriptional regulator [Kineothrix alysoides]|uniref:TetR family transcriptional regulator n=1 Tax=Kineothrix alysoides TaxID=1469948 RepID=A0A4V2QCE8_9FIRM|nr:TetR/AcrR family transcriptional regulator [Kineothrix alysoides]TCL60007.1 TetR family transcriptional regulator [Kineothrix alysoides]
MARPIKKSPEQWTQEIINAAQHFFITNGYDETSISDIMNAVKGAKGTFYQFFESKELLLETLVEKWAGDYEKAIIRILDNTNTTFADKFSEIMNLIKQMSGKTLGMETFFHPSNDVMIYKLTKRMTTAITPYLEEVLKIGMEENLFSLDNSHFYASFIINGALGALSSGAEAPANSIPQTLKLLPEITANILGIDSGVLFHSKEDSR